MLEKTLNMFQRFKRQIYIPFPVFVSYMLQLTLMVSNFNEACCIPNINGYLMWFGVKYFCTVHELIHLMDIKIEIQRKKAKSQRISLSMQENSVRQTYFSEPYKNIYI